MEGGKDRFNPLGVDRTTRKGGRGKRTNFMGELNVSGKYLIYLEKYGKLICS